jgi:hypothetical protein
MFHNRIRRFAQVWDRHETESQAIVPAGFVLIPIQHLPAAMQQMVGCRGELYRMAYEQALASAELAGIDPDWFLGEGV